MKKLFSISWGKSVFISIILVVVLALLLWRPILVLYHQQQAGKIIDQVATSIESSDLISYRCFLGQINKIPPSEIPIAINHLMKARELQLTNNYTTYLLGQAYCLNHEFEQAINYLEKAQALRENNPIPFIETGFAYFSLITISDENNLQTVEEYRQNSESAFLKSHASPEIFLTYARDAYKSRDFYSSYKLFQLGSIFFPLNYEDGFQAAISERIVRQSTSYFHFPFDIAEFTLNEPSNIDLETVLNLSDGKPITINMINGEPTGVIPSNYRDAIVFVNFSNNNAVCISSMVHDRKPAPIEVQFELDSAPIGLISLANENDLWVKFETETDVRSGLHIISLRFLNDAIINDIDRNVYFKDLAIEFCK